MTETKAVLVTYLERNKVLKVPPNHEYTSDIGYLESAFRTEFSFEQAVNLTITFQKFDEDWNEYIDLEADAILQHKDKVKAVVSAKLVDLPSTPETATPHVRELECANKSAFKHTYTYPFIQGFRFYSSLCVLYSSCHLQL